MIENLHWLGNSSFKITNDKVIYIDPFEVKVEHEKADIILITHSHFDHFSPEDIDRLKKGTTVVIAPDDCKMAGNIKNVKPGDKLNIKGVSVEVVSAYNVNKRFHPKSNRWVGYIIKAKGKRIYHAGDTDRISEMDDIKTDIALLPIGGYSTMTAEEAADAASKIKPEIAVPMHFGSVVGSLSDAEQFKRVCDVPVEILKKE